ncbi:8942_t:CDS:2 [Cetraspora pellucida]|uniref:8942_t:CDS:1 n=1 Tax=Cetraspora pellucida TaxID=1433469 RepID=A0A9N9CW02_9GLOM|nr:8942_t:CDS:2 [Cetraspora pellucida]
MIPPTSFSNYNNLETYWNYLYPWGSHHNGAALMLGNSSYHQNIYLKNSVLKLKAIRKNIRLKKLSFHYLSGAIHAKNHLEVNDQFPYYVLCSDFIAPMIPGAWPAFWLTSATSWPPEVDMLEFKGDKNNNFNIFINKTKSVYSNKVPITRPNDWNTYCISMKKVNDTDVKVTFSLNNHNSITHTASGYVGKQFWLIINLQMEGSSGLSGEKVY